METLRTTSPDSCIEVSYNLLRSHFEYLHAHVPA